MTQIDPEYTDDDLDEDPSTLVRNLRKQLKESNKRAAAAEERAEQNGSASRRVAFLDAGIPDTPQTQFFREHYSGELDPETIKAQAMTHGFITPEDHSDEVNAIQGMSEGVQGGDRPSVPGTDMSEFDADVAAAVAKAPRGGEAKAIDEVYQRYQRTVS